MEKLPGQKFSSFEAADRAEDEYYKSLSPNERVEILLTIIAQHKSQADGSSDRFERVFRVAALSES